MYYTGLPQALAMFGLKVELVPGWSTRGDENFSPEITIAHHTAGPSTGDRPSLGVCVNGRSDLPGPLCNTFQPRSGGVIVVAAGRANHAGRGSYRGLTGNSKCFGTETEDNGDGSYTPEQLRDLGKVHAAQLFLASDRSIDKALGRIEYVIHHRTWAPERKIDMAGISLAHLREMVRQELINMKWTTEVTGATDGGPRGPWPWGENHKLGPNGDVGTPSFNPTWHDGRYSYGDLQERWSIEAWQREVGATVTGVWNLDTMLRTQRWQTAVGLPATGYPGKLEWEVATTR